jgi:hypothetical protein
LCGLRHFYDDRLNSEKFEGATDVISYRISNEKKKDENTNNDPQNTTYKIKD